VSLLVFDDIHKSYGDNVALRGVSFEVRPGEVFGLLGPNGAGKTTLMRILMDIIRADSGRVVLFGEPFRRDHLDRLGYLPEERGLYKKHRVLDILTYFGTLKGLDRAVARARGKEWLKRVDLEHVAAWRVERLSKGMSQKVQIAATLLAEPELCVLDEPSTGLDPVNVEMVEDLIRARRSAGKTTVLSTHQMNQVESLCDRVALIHHGRLMVYGEVGEVRRRHSLPEVRVALRGEPPALAGVERVDPEGGSLYRMRLADGTEPAKLLAALVAAGHEVSHFEVVLTPMEDVFRQVVRKAAA
jgi:ABC-2 type transport system ATP-binding protein